MSGNYESRGKRTTKVLSLVLALVLVIGASVGGTLAWLTAQTPEVVNTFASAELFDSDDTQNPGSFDLWEHKVADTNADGVYEFTTEKTEKGKGNEYIVLPGVNIPKNPTVDVKNLEANAYLYIKVTSTLSTGMSYEIGTDWEKLTGYDNVWVYKGANADDTNKVIQASETSKKTFTVEILKDNQVVVAKDYSGTAEVSLSFEAYMVQATGNGANAAEAWGNTYGNNTGSTTN